MPEKRNWLGSRCFATVVTLVFAVMAALALSMPLRAQDQPLNPWPSAFQRALNRNAIDLTLPPRGRSIVVNIPAFELIAFENARPVFRSRVIIGTPWHRTPRLTTYTTAVRFRPTWRPTPAMIASGEYVDKVWPPGINNPLGLLAVRLEPGLLVYLHDTNHRELFDKDYRALSHGCVRVQRWDELAAWVLGIGLEEVHAFANGRRTFDMPTEAVPVILGYFTAFPDDQGRLVRYDDIYRLDRAQADGTVPGEGAVQLAQAATRAQTCTRM